MVFIYNFANSVYNNVISAYSKSDVSKGKLCHGTTFSTLYLMGKLKGEDEHNLMPFGALATKKIPVFAGECFKGIADKGCNQKYTSWVEMHKAATAIEYAKNFPFDPKKSKQVFQEIIEDTQLVLAGHRTKSRDYDAFTRNSVPFAIDCTSTYWNAHWNQMILKIRQIKAWDEEDFDKELKEGLSVWIENVILYAIDVKKMIGEKDYDKVMEKLNTIKDEIKNPSAFSLTTTDRESIQKTHPIVFISPRNDLGVETGRTGETFVEQKMKLGEEIRWIATEEASVGEVEAYLKLINLANRVTVITFEKLKELSKSYTGS